MRSMRLICLAAVTAVPMIAMAAEAAADDPYRILRVVKVGGEGGFDYVKADAADRRLYITRHGKPPEIDVFDLDTLKLVGVIPNVGGAGALADPKSGHGFASSKPVTMFDAKTLKKIKDIQVDNRPDDLMVDPFNDRLYVWSHTAPAGAVIDAVTGNVLGTIDLDGAVEESVSDGAGHVYVAFDNNGTIAVVDAKTMKVTAHYPLLGKDDNCGGLAIDTKNRILFAGCRDKKVMVILSADTGKIITTLPLPDISTDGEGFNQETMENFSSHANGTLTVIKENSPTSFVVEQNLKTIDNGKAMAFDSKTGHVFITGAEYLPAPADAVKFKGRPARGPTVPGSFSIVEVGK
jgi:DNA-binding beta-propeller fold protein YncE